MNIQFDVNELFKELAQKLGTTVDYVMELLVRQMYVSSINNILIAIGILIIAVILSKSFKVFQEQVHSSIQVEVKKRHERGYSYSSDTEVFLRFGLVVMKVLPIINIIVALLVTVHMVSTALMKILNPEWMAIQYIIDLLK